MVGASAPSSVARSPGYCRTQIGRAPVPVRKLVNGPQYVPPLSQMVSPGRAGPVADSAVAKSRGRSMRPSLTGEPDGDAYRSRAAAGDAAASTRAAHSTRRVKIEGTRAF